MSLHLRARARAAALAAAALVLGGVVAASPASAEPVTPGLHWGFRQSFRSYVGNPGNSAPDKIAPQSPASFEGEGSSVTRPYLFPVASGVVTDADSFRIALAGGVTYSYPAHTFMIDLSDLALVVEDGSAEVLADVRVTTTDPSFTPVSANDVVIGTSESVDSVLEADGLAVLVSGLELTSEGAAALNGFLSAGSELDDIVLSVPLEGGEVAWTPYLSLLSTTVEPWSTEIEVRGYGFEYGLKRASYIGNAVVGPYVRLGTLIGEWRPSQGAEGSTRTKVSQIWAVDETGMENPMVGGQGGVLFEPDGSFQGILEGEKADFDSLAGTPALYAYTTGPAVAAWEIDSPVTVNPWAVPTVQAQPRAASAVVGSSAKFSVLGDRHTTDVRWERKLPGGQWEPVAGASSASLTVLAGSVAQNGTQFRAVLSNPEQSRASDAARLTVTKATPSVRVSVKSKLTFASKPKATVTVTAPKGVAANGKVKVKAGSSVVGTGTVKNGKASVTLSSKLTPGAKKLVAEFAGNADLVKAKSPSIKVSVAKAKAKVTAKLKKSKVKKTQRAVLKVSVKATGTKPAGTVKVLVKKGSKTVKTLKVKVSKGKTFSVRLPRLTKGKYSVQASFQGSKTVAKKSAKKVTLRVS